MSDIMRMIRVARRFHTAADKRERWHNAVGESQYFILMGEALAIDDRPLNIIR